MLLIDITQFDHWWDEKVLLFELPMEKQYLQEKFLQVRSSLQFIFLVFLEEDIDYYVLLFNWKDIWKCLSFILLKGSLSLKGIYWEDTEVTVISI